MSKLTMPSFDRKPMHASSTLKTRRLDRLNKEPLGGHLGETEAVRAEATTG